MIHDVYNSLLLNYELIYSQDLNNILMELKLNARPRELICLDGINWQVKITINKIKSLERSNMKTNTRRHIVLITKQYA